MQVTSWTFFNKFAWSGKQNDFGMASLKRSDVAPKWQSGFKMKCKTNQQRLVVGVYCFVVNHPLWGKKLLRVLTTYAWKLEGK